MVAPEPLRRLEEEIAGGLARIPTVLNEYGYDAWGFSPETSRRVLTLMGLLYRYWFRVELHGIENLPEGRALVIANHSGQIPLDAESGEIVGATPAEQARRCLENLQTVCRAAGAELGDAVRCTVYMTDLSAFAEVNEVYAEFFAADPPARAVGVSALPKGAQVEIDAIVSLNG